MRDQSINESPTLLLHALPDTDTRRRLFDIVRIHETLVNLADASRLMVEAADDNDFRAAVVLTRKYIKMLDNIRAISATLPRSIPVADSIIKFFICQKCAIQKPADQTLSEWTRLNCGWTEIGFQVWCTRHGCNVAHIDFEGHKFSANTCYK